MLIKAIDVGPSAPWLKPDFLQLFRIPHHSYNAGGKLPGGVYEPYLEQWWELQVSLMICVGHVPIHEDSHELPPYCYHAILCNHIGYGAKGPRQSFRWGPKAKQLPGTIIGLNIHLEHHLVRDQRIKPALVDVPCWASLCFNSEIPLSDEGIILHFTERTELIRLYFKAANTH